MFCPPGDLDYNYSILVFGNNYLDMAFYFSGRNDQKISVEIFFDSNFLSYLTQETGAYEGDGVRCSRSVTNGDVIEAGSSALAKCICLNNASKLWNRAPLSIRSCESLFSVKREIEKFVRSLPV